MCQKMGKGVQEGNEGGKDEGKEETLYKAKTFSYPFNH